MTWALRLLGHALDIFVDVLRRDARAVFTLDLLIQGERLSLLVLRFEYLGSLFQADRCQAVVTREFCGFRERGDGLVELVGRGLAVGRRVKRGG